MVRVAPASGRCSQQVRQLAAQPWTNPALTRSLLQLDVAERSLTRRAGAVHTRLRGVVRAQANQAQAARFLFRQGASPLLPLALYKDCTGSASCQVGASRYRWRCLQGVFLSLTQAMAESSSTICSLRLRASQAVHPSHQIRYRWYFGCRAVQAAAQWRACGRK